MLAIVKKLFKRFSSVSTDENSVDDQSLPISNTDEPEDNTERCFDCKGTHFYEGPSGGASTNIKCGDCGSYFNSSGIFPLERIRWIDHTIVAKNFIPFDPYMIADWQTIIIYDFAGPFPKHVYHMHKTESEMNNMLPMITFWCSVELSGRWSIKSSLLYFELEEDAISFKLKWC